MKRSLITTAEESLWEFENPAIFLGEWCRLYERKHIWNSMDAIVADEYGSSHITKMQNLDYSQELTKKIFPQIVDNLNKLHNNDFSDNFWKIVIGPWLKSIIEILINRIKTLETVISTNNITNANFAEIPSEEFIPKDLKELHYNQIRSNIFNSMLDYKILSQMPNVNFTLNLISKNVDYLSLPKSELTTKKEYYTKDLKRRIKDLSNAIYRDTEPFIIDTYLPRKIDNLFQLSYFKLPKFYEDDNTYSSEKSIDLDFRKQVKIELSGAKNNEHIYANLISSMIPSIYLEEFEKTMVLIKDLKWPKNPKFIFTSNRFTYDEIFKIYAALQSDNGVKYFVGQHGNNYGTRIFSEPRIEEITPNKFFTWGWESKSGKHIPSFCFKTAGLKQIGYNQNGKLLLIMKPASERIETWDTTGEYNRFLEEQKLFILSLKNQISDKTLIRHHPDPSKIKFATERRLEELNKNLEFESGTANILNLEKESKLVVHTYDSTGMLETLSLNIPTICFWQDQLFGLNHSAKSKYGILFDAGIIHFNPVSAAEKINSVWDDLETWWTSAKVQEARQLFCSNYAKSCEKPIRVLRRIIKENL